MKAAELPPQYLLKGIVVPGREEFYRREGFHRREIEQARLPCRARSWRFAPKAHIKTVILVPLGLTRQPHKKLLENYVKRLCR